MTEESALRADRRPLVRPSLGPSESHVNRPQSVNIRDEAGLIPNVEFNIQQVRHAV